MISLYVSDSELRSDRWNRVLPGIDAITEELVKNAKESNDGEIENSQMPMLKLLKLLRRVNQNIQYIIYSSTVSLVEKFSVVLTAVTTLSELLHPFNLDLYSKRCQAFSAALMIDQREKAIELGHKLIEFLDHAYKEIPYHPLLGLQLFTLGDLNDEMGNKVESRQAYQRALEILRIAFGSDHEFCRILKEQLRKA